MMLRFAFFLQLRIHEQLVDTGEKTFASSPPQVLANADSLQRGSVQYYRPVDRSELRNCTTCFGCKNTLQLIGTPVKMLNEVYLPETGVSGVWVFHVQNGSGVQDEEKKDAFVKV